MDKWTDGEELFRFSKNSSEDVVLRLHRLTVGRYVDIRIWNSIRSGDGVASGPTDRGLMLDAELLPDLRKAIDQVLKALGTPAPCCRCDQKGGGFRFDFAEEPEGKP